MVCVDGEKGLWGMGARDRGVGSRTNVYVSK